MVSLPVPPRALLGEPSHHISVASDRLLWFSRKRASFGAANGMCFCSSGACVFSLLLLLLFQGDKKRGGEGEMLLKLMDV